MLLDLPGMLLDQPAMLLDSPVPRACMRPPRSPVRLAPAPSILARALVCALLCAPVAVPFRCAVAGVFPYPIQTVRLDNGCLLVMVPMPTPGVVHDQTIVRAGSRNEIEPGRTGYAHFFEHMMFRGTPRHPEAEYNRILDVLGADHNASTDMDQTSFYVTLPSSGLGQAISLEADRFRNLTYTPEQFRK